MPQAKAPDWGTALCPINWPFTNSVVVLRMSAAQATSHTEHNSLWGMAMGAVAFALMTTVDTIFKLMAEHHPAHQILFVNGALALIPVVLWAMMTGGVTRLKTAHPFRHLARGCLSVMSAFAAIYAYSRLPLTDYYAIVFAGPLIATALSAFWLGEKIDRSRCLAILGGFAGILIVVTPSLSALDSAGSTKGRIAALASVFCYALSVTVIRRMRRGESSVAFTFYGYLACVAIAGLAFLVRGGPPLNAGDFLHLMLSGTLAGISTICLMTAFHRCPVALVAPFQYTQIIWGSLAGYLLWGHVPEARLVAGATVVAGCGLFIIYREMRAKDAALPQILTINRS